MCVSMCVYLSSPAPEALFQSEGGHGVGTEIVNAFIFPCFHHCLVHSCHVFLVDVQLPTKLT